jgi:LysM repeat protein
MTYSLAEKEEILFENKVNNLLAELDYSPDAMAADAKDPFFINLAKKFKKDNEERPYLHWADRSIQKLDPEWRYDSDTTGGSTTGGSTTGGSTTGSTNTTAVTPVIAEPVVEPPIHPAPVVKAVTTAPRHITDPHPEKIVSHHRPGEPNPPDPTPKAKPPQTAAGRAKAKAVAAVIAAQKRALGLVGLQSQPGPGHLTNKEAANAKKLFLSTSQREAASKHIRKLEFEKTEKLKKLQAKKHTIMLKLQTTAEVAKPYWVKQLRIVDDKISKITSVVTAATSAREVKLRKIATQRLEVATLKKLEQKATTSGTSDDLAKLVKQRQTIETAISKAEQVAFDLGASHEVIARSRLDPITQKLTYTKLPDPIPGQLIRIPNQSLLVTQQTLIDTVAAAKAKVEKLSGPNPDADLFTAAKEKLKQATNNLKATNNLLAEITANNKNVSLIAKINTDIIAKETRITQLTDIINDPTKIQVQAKYQKLKTVADTELQALRVEAAAWQEVMKTGTHTLKKGETISVLGKLYGIDYQEIMKLNNITTEGARRLKIGKEIIIPGIALRPAANLTPAQIQKFLTIAERAKIPKNANGSLLPVSVNKNGKFVITEPDGTIKLISKLPTRTVALASNTEIGTISKKRAFKMNHPEGTILKIINDKPYLISPDRKRRYPISKSNANVILKEMGHPPGFVLRVAKKTILSPALTLLKLAALPLTMPLRASLRAVFPKTPLGEVVSYVVLESMIKYGNARMLRNLFAEQARMAAENPDNPLAKLAPAQYYGGIGKMTGLFPDDMTQRQWLGLVADQPEPDKGWPDTVDGWKAVVGSLLAEPFVHDQDLIRTMKARTPKNEVDIEKSFVNMENGEVDDWRTKLTIRGKSGPEINAQFLRNNIVTIMTKGGILYRINPWGLGEPGEDGKDDNANNEGALGGGIPGKKNMTPVQMMTLVLQPGNVLQVIPTHNIGGKGNPEAQATWDKLEARIIDLTKRLSKAKYDSHRTNLNKQIEDLRNDQKPYARDAGRTKIPQDDQTKNMKTIYLNGDYTGEFTGIEHYVSDKEERGGRIIIKDSAGNTKEMYIPTKNELNLYLTQQIESTIPSDWYLGYRDPRRMYGYSEEDWAKLSKEKKKEAEEEGIKSTNGWFGLGDIPRPESQVEWLKKHGLEGPTAQRFDAFKFAGPDMTDKELIDWWRDYSEEHKISPPDSYAADDWALEFKGWRLTDMASDKIGTELRGLKTLDFITQYFGMPPAGWTEGAATDAHSLLTYINREDLKGIVPEDILKSMYNERGQIILPKPTRADIDKSREILKLEPLSREPITTPVAPEAPYVKVPPKTHAEARDVLVQAQDKIRISNQDNPDIMSKAPGYNRPANFGWPTTIGGYNQVMQELSDRNDIHVNLLKALAKIESETQILVGKPGTVKQGTYIGDPTMGTEGARGLFHVRKGNPGSPAGVDDYNDKHKNDKEFTPVTWQDISTDTLLAAHIGAEHFAGLYRKARATYGDLRAAEEAYAAYNAGWGWRTRTKPDGKTLRYGTATQAKILARGIKFAGWIAESKNYSNKSAILEGIALAA